MELNQTVKDNLATRYAEINEGLAGRLHLPVRTANIALTNRCNLYCKICYLCSKDFEHHTYNNEEPYTLSLEEFKSTFSDEWFQKHTTASEGNSIVFVQGETFLVPDFYDILCYLRQNLPYAYISVVTNGTIPLTALKKRAESSEYGNKSFAELLSMISFSLDGYKKETFETIRTPAKFEPVYNNILMWSDEVKKYAPGEKKLRFGVALSKLNISELPDIVKWAGELGTFTGVYTQPLVNPKHLEDLDDWMLDHVPAEEGRAYLEKAIQYGKEYDIDVDIESAVLEMFGIDTAPQAPHIIDPCSARFCDGLWDGRLVISKEGQLRWLCCRFTEEQSFELMDRYRIPRDIDSIDAYNSPEYWLLRKDFLEGKYDLLEYCKGCAHGEYALEKFSKISLPKRTSQWVDKNEYEALQEKMENQLELANQQLEKFENSISWKLTKPLRFFRRLISK